MAWTVENQAGVDARLIEVGAATSYGCVNVTINPLACGDDCTLTFYRNAANCGITLATKYTTIGFYGFTTGPTSVTFSSNRILADGSASSSSNTVTPGYTYTHDIPIVSVNGINNAQFFSIGTTKIIPIPTGITGTGNTYSTITFKVPTPPKGGIKTVQVGTIRNNNKGEGINFAQYGNGGASVHLCDPK